VAGNPVPTADPVETPQYAGTNLPGVHGRGVSPRRVPSTPALRPVNTVGVKTVKTPQGNGVSRRAAGVGGGWGLETPRPCTPGRFVPADWGRLYAGPAPAASAPHPRSSTRVANTVARGTRAAARAVRVTAREARAFTRVANTLARAVRATARTVREAARAIRASARVARVAARGPRGLARDARAPARGSRALARTVGVTARGSRAAA